MMELLMVMVRNLVIIILVATLLELIMPSGKLKPLVQMTIGFFVIITILNPVLSLLFKQETLVITAFALPEAVNRQLNQAMITGQDANKELQTGVNQQLALRMEGQIRSLALLVPEIGEIEPRVKLDDGGKIKEVELLVRAGNGEISPLDEKVPAFISGSTPENSEEMERKLKEWISSYYQVSPERVNINWR